MPLVEITDKDGVSIKVGCDERNSPDWVLRQARELYDYVTGKAPADPSATATLSKEAIEAEAARYSSQPRRPYVEPPAAVQTAHHHNPYG